MENLSKFGQDCIIYLLETLVLAILHNTCINNSCLRDFFQPAIHPYLDNTEIFGNMSILDIIENIIARGDLDLHQSQFCMWHILGVFKFRRFKVYSKTFGTDIWMVESIDHWLEHGLPKFEDETFKVVVKNYMLPYLAQLSDVVNKQPEILNKKIIMGNFFYHCDEE